MSQVEEKKVGLGKNRKKFPEKNFNPLNFYEMNEITYHTRHIPEEHLDLSKNAAKVIKGNGLCDALDIDNLRFLKKQGVDTIELRLVWWELETSPEHFSWSRFERDLNKVRNAGFKAGLMAWLNYPPPWYLKQSKRAVCFKCLDHNQETATLSLWDPKTLEAIKRLYEIIAKRYGDYLDFVYVTSSGDFGEPMLPHGVEHYKFSSRHSHSGIFWTGDHYARLNWQEFIKEKYRSIKMLNSAWNTNFTSWNDDFLNGITDPQRVNNYRRLDYIRWIMNSTAEYNAKMLGIIQECFPHAHTGFPVGGAEEAGLGQLKSLCVKKVSQINGNCVARWTAINACRDFSRSHALASRLSSAARFYGLPFGEEGDIRIEREHAVAGIYEGINNGATMWHNDLGNIKRSKQYKAVPEFPFIFVGPPITQVVLFHPIEQESLDIFDTYVLSRGVGSKSTCACLKRYLDQAGKLRQKTNFDVCDSLMIFDGFLKNKHTLVFVDSTVIPTAIIPMLKEFTEDGNEIILANSSKVTVIETETALEDIVENGIKKEKDLPIFPEYEKMKKEKNEFITVHNNHITYFFPERNEIVIEKVNL